MPPPWCGREEFAFDRGSVVAWRFEGDLHLADGGPTGNGSILPAMDG
jgi:hypothetical protein